MPSRAHFPRPKQREAQAPQGHATPRRKPLNIKAKEEAVERLKKAGWTRRDQAGEIHIHAPSRSQRAKHFFDYIVADEEEKRKDEAIKGSFRLTG